MKINKKLLMAALASAVIVSAPQAKTYTLSNAESVATNTELGLSEEKPQAAVRASQEATNPNYAEDEKNVGTYKETQLERGNGPAFSISNESSMNYIDGFRYSTVEPSATSDSKTLWGFEIEFDRDQGQRTYTDFGFTNTGNMGAYLNPGNIAANDVGVKVAEKGGFKEANYKAVSEINITASRTQRNLNLYATVEDLAHINSIDNKNTTIGWKSDYTKDNPNGLKATEGGSAAFNFTVNPWPNENDQLNLIYLNGDYDKKVFVQGQTIETGIKVENLDDNARERLVGQVYHPVSGEVVPGAEAYIDKNDKVVIKMPDGVIDENGNLNTDSIFYKDLNYVAQQNLKVKFFARPRTEAEFRAVGVEANYGEDKYTSTGAGTEVINHKGKKVTIDKQGIPRYDHYNLIGEFDINLDDTRYYDQGFLDKNKKDTSKHTHSKVKPGEEFEVNLYVPEDKKNKDVFPYQKTPEEMEAAKSEKQAIGTIDWQFINKINEGKKLEDQWKLEYDESTLPTTFKITPPKSAKAGEFVAVPLTYTYTNGSTDVHWFHFVVQESTNNVPEYYVQVEYPSEEQKSTPKLPEDPDNKKLKPVKYTIKDGAGFKDNKGNEWTVSIDETTGVVTAKPKDQSKFDGGETLTVPVVAHYEDPNEPDKDITEETKAEFVIKEKANMTPRYNAKAGKAGDELSSEVILNEEDKFNRRPTKFTLESDTFTDDKGNTWSVTIDEDTGTVTAKVPNGEGDKIDGALLNVPVTAHYYEVGSDKEIGTRNVEVQFVASGTDGTYTKTQEIPFETKVEKDPKLKKGEIKVITEGKKGSKEVTYVIKNSQIDESKTTEKILEKPQERLIHVGEGTEDGKHEIKETVEVPYEVEIQFDDSLKPGEQKVTQEGIPGEKTRTTTITIQDGNVTNTQVGEYTQTKAPQKKIIKVGANTEGKVVHEEKIPFKYEISYDEKLKSGEYVIDVPGTEGTRKTTWTIKNSKIVGEPEVETKDPVNAVIRVGKKDFTGTLETKKTKAIEFKTEYKVDNSLESGQVVVEQEGSLGEEETTVTHTIVNGEVTKSEEGQPVQTKAPVKRIVKVGPGKTDGTHEYTNKIPYEVEIRVNPELKKDERKVIQKGEVGEEKYTIKIENSMVVETSDPVVTKEAKKEIIEVGTEDYTGEFEYVDKEVIPFDTEVKINPNLEPNQIKEITPGENGSKERKVTQKYTNGEKGDLVVGEYEVTKQPVTRVIEVGPGKTDGTHTYTSKKPFEVEVRVNPELPKGEYKVVQKGVDGEEEYTITIENSKVTNISDPKETKAPVNEIIEVGEGSTDGEVKHVEEIPFKYQVEESDELKPGEYKIVKPGKVGTITTTWTIKDSKVVGDPKVERVEPEDALIQVGKGTPDGTHDFTEKKELPFETIIEYDDSLEPGEEKVVQEGKPGEQERTNTIVIENGKVKEIKEGTFETTTKPVNKIIKIGRKKPDGETTKTVEREIPYETKVIYDENLEAGFQEIEKEGKPGKEKVTITTKIVDGKLVTTETKETITEKEDRVVRIGVKPVVKETELGHDTEYRYNPNLKEGEQNVIEEGTNGKVEYTITFNKETGKIEVSEKRTEPKNKIVEIGYKTDGKVKVESEIPFEVEIIEDPEMEAGKTEVVQEGKLGKKETTVTIENSKEVSREENIIEKPVKKIIKVGTKNVCEIPPVDPENPDKPGDKDPENPDKPGDKDPETPGKPGDKDPGTPGEDPKDPDKDPGKEDPKDPETPGGKDPKDPEQPGGEDPKDPEQPGGKDPKDPDKDPGKEDPKDPEQPGEEDPKDPEQPGGKDPKDPEQPGGEDPKDPETPGKTPENNGKTPENNGKKPENNGKTPGATGQVDGKSTTTNNKTPKRLPKSGSESEIMTLAMSGLLTAAGFIGLKKKRKDR
ncbi:MAG: G5 domain-containing protein [Finegoldia magna]|uniref:G5 domain-containing protein n=1 Tax=Finegoldia magna TaxID=1260 RepID=UPI00291212A8|nr:G5 domain-containing protein [Finegoldia magna]MDU4333987.1 G5 domain-containing protein [Finegoldia magna]